jgi:pimeloyl-ACP methyl ester carboxylesterase
MARSVLRDRAAALRGRLMEIPLVGPPGSLAIMTGDDADSKYPGLYPPGHEFVNRVPARSLMRVGFYSPGRDAARVRCPLLVIVAEGDTITPPRPARRAARRAPRGELESFDGRHFDIYRGERFEWAVERETEFLRRALGIGAGAG